MNAAEQAALDALKAECRKAIELGDAATKRPWIIDYNCANLVIGADDTEVATVAEDEDALLIANSRAFSPLAAQRLLVAIGALEEISATMREFGLHSSWQFIDQKLQQIIAIK